MNRKEFLQLCTGVISGFGIQGMLVDSANASSADNVLSDSYLVKGLTGMARSEGHWFGAHWGAGILAGYYLCKENSLNQETVAAIRKQLDRILKLHESQFAPLPDEPTDTALIEDVPKALSPAMQGGLRAHGHAVIFASLSTKALRDVPHMAQPTLVKRLCKLSDTISKSRPQKPRDDTSYINSQAMIDATFNNVAGFKDVLGRPSIMRPNFTHMFTHTDALLTLESMGYPRLAKAGWLGHTAHISTPVPEIDPKIHPQANHATLDEVMDKSYWENEQNVARWNRKFDAQSNRNGNWIASGHLFKVLYSYHRLTKLVEDKELVRLCSMILLERYINPDVQGG